MMKITEDLIKWISNYCKDTGVKKVIIGISGGKDSTICASLLEKAIGAENIIAVMMPNGVQKDLGDSYDVCDCIGIPDKNRYQVNIASAFEGIIKGIYLGSPSNVVNDWGNLRNNDNIDTNLPSRLRMCTLYTIASLYDGSRVVNTSNKSERYIGYSTKWGDGIGDFSPLGNLTVREVLQIGDDLGLPYSLVHKTPSDGMSGKSDEEKIGFTYEELDEYLLGDFDRHPSKDTISKIEKMHNANKHKIDPMPTFIPKEISQSVYEGGK